MCVCVVSQTNSLTPSLVCQLLINEVISITTQYSLMLIHTMICHAHLQVTHPDRSPHRLIESSGPVDIEALKQLMGNDESLGLGVTGDAYPLPILLGRLTPVPVSKARIALIQQVAHQLGQKCLKGMHRERINR